MWWTSAPTAAAPVRSATPKRCARVAGAKGIQLAKMTPSSRRGGLSLDHLSAEFERQGLPLPDYIRTDLEADQKANSATALQEYEL